MIILLSPAKKLLPIIEPFNGEMSEPKLLAKTEVLVKIMREQKITDIARLMDLSADLARLNYDRYQSFHLKQIPINACYPAMFLFQGDVYQGLQAMSWSTADVQYAQEHLVILSGLYGLLKPLDAIQPYRLEMGVRLANPKGNNLYEYWGTSIAEYLNNALERQDNPMIINLASTEYFKVVQEKKLAYPCVTINFYEQKGAVLKMIGIHAKKARGVMAKYLMQNQVNRVEQIKDFKELGYCFNAKTSSSHHIDFVRVS